MGTCERVCADSAYECSIGAREVSPHHLDSSFSRLRSHCSATPNHMFARTSDALRRAEEELFTAGKSWWRSWQAREGLKPPQTPTVFIHSDVQTGADNHIHMVSCRATPTGDECPAAPPIPLVCVHGFGHSASCFYNSLAPLAERWGGTVPIPAKNLPRPSAYLDFHSLKD